MNIANPNASIPHLPLTALDLAAHAASTYNSSVTYQTRVRYLCSVATSNYVGIQTSIAVNQIEQALIMYTHRIPMSYCF